ncbi:MAG: DUF1499 domain-containing protein [Sulfitobacter sp.]
MRVIKLALLAVPLLGIAALAYVRFAPGDAAHWHQPITATKDAEFSNGAIRVIETDATGLARIDDAMAVLPRTKVLSGSVDEGRITYVTRSQVFGFPDYLTAEQTGDVLKLSARARYGLSDIGVNRARLRQVLAIAKLR